MKRIVFILLLGLFIVACSSPTEPQKNIKTSLRNTGERNARR
jgi:PBP1b-binding outer membrane lipoprotein LpoB